jgi:hypothetical protein
MSAEIKKPTTNQTGTTMKTKRYAVLVVDGDKWRLADASDNVPSNRFDTVDDAETAAEKIGSRTVVRVIGGSMWPDYLPQ